jgi:hypothetical protein
MPWTKLIQFFSSHVEGDGILFIITNVLKTNIMIFRSDGQSFTKRIFPDLDG